MVANNNESWDFLCQESSPEQLLGFPEAMNFEDLQVTTADQNVDPSPKSYVERTFLFLEAQFLDNALFPSGYDIPFPKNFRLRIKQIFEKMFYVLAIVFSNYCLYEKSDYSVLLRSLRHFLYFAWYWKLLDEDTVIRILPTVAVQISADFKKLNK